MQDHEHIDRGHSHADAGHTHTDTGHFHTYEHMDTEEPPPVPHMGCSPYWTEGGQYDCATEPKNDQSLMGKADIQSSWAQIQTSTSNVGKMSTGNIGGETRPINMRVVWIIKAW